MKSRNETSAAALWVIALSLLMIAVCLLFIVVGQWTSTKPESTALVASSSPADVVFESAPVKTPGRLFTPPVHRSVHNAPVRNETNQEAPALANSGQKPEPASSTPVLIGSPAPIPAPVLIADSQVVTLIQGTVTLAGVPPAEKSIPCDTHPTTRFFLTDTNHGLKDTLIYISKGLPAYPPPHFQFTNELVLSNCLIEPYISAMQSPPKAVIRDSLGTFHSMKLRAAESPVITSGFGLSAGAAAILRLPKQGNFVTLSCEVHPWEVAYISVMDNPFFAISDSDGSFSLTNVPPGNYTLTALHRRPGSTQSCTQQIQVREGEIARADFVFEEQAPRQLSSR